MPRDYDCIERRTQDVMIEKRCLVKERCLGIGTLRLRDLYLAFGDGQIGGGHIDIALCLFGGLRRPKLLIIDEPGSLPFEANAAHLFFQLVSRRYEKGSILLTSNRSVGEWGGLFGDPVVATAILDWLLHHSTVITIRGDSYQLREKRRSGLLQKAGSAQEDTETSAS